MSSDHWPRSMADASDSVSVHGLGDKSRQNRALLFRYDGSFSGLLCAAREASHMTAPDFAGYTFGFKPQTASELLFDDSFYVRSDVEEARRIWARAARLGYLASLRTCFEAYCSDCPGREDFVGRVLCSLLVEARGKNSVGQNNAHPKGPRSFAILDNLSDADQLSVVKAAGRCRNQVQKICGLLRFSEMSGEFLYAAISPDCDLLALIAPHFARRFASLSFMIHDRRRAKAILHQPGAGWKIVDGISVGVGKASRSTYSERESLIQEIWRRYFSSVSIEARKNPKLQASHMPKKYWPGLPEMCRDTIETDPELSCAGSPLSVKEDLWMP